MTINLHDLTGQESGIILVETDDGRHMNMVANWGAKDGLPYLFEPMLEPFSFLFLPSEDVHVETERIHSGALNDEIARRSRRLEPVGRRFGLGRTLRSIPAVKRLDCRRPEGMELTKMKTRNVLNTVAHTLPDWHVVNDRQFGRITAYDPQARYEITVNLPDRDTIRIVRTQYELAEDNTVLNTSDMGEEQALAELARLLAAPMPRTDRLMWLKDQFDKTAEWWRNTIGDEQMAKDTDDMAERYMHVCEYFNKYPERDPVSVFKGWLLCEKLGSPYETRRQTALHMLADVWQLDKD